MSTSRADETTAARARTLGSATLHEAAGRIGALPARIKAVRPGMTIAGPARTVSGPSGDNLWLHHAILAAEPGDVLVAEVGPDAEYGYWGEVMAVAAAHRGIVGLVIDGGVRDADQLATRGFPVFAATICVRGTGKDPRGAGTIGQPVRLGSTIIHTGDLVVGDGDGVVCIPADRVDAVVAGGVRRVEQETRIFQRLERGESSLDVYDLPQVQR